METTLCHTAIPKKKLRSMELKRAAKMEKERLLNQHVLFYKDTEEGPIEQFAYDWVATRGLFTRPPTETEVDEFFEAINEYLEKDGLVIDMHEWIDVAQRSFSRFTGYDWYGCSVEQNPLVIGSTRFAKMQIPPREPFLVEGTQPVFLAKSTNQILGWRGLGKTNIGLTLAGVMSIGGEWIDMTAPKPRRVLYIDGELPMEQLQERVQTFTKPNANLLLVSRDILGQQLNLLPQKGKLGAVITPMRDRLVQEIHKHGVEVLFLDSLSTLFPMPTNEEEMQIALQEEMQFYRSLGLCVVNLHHVGKLGSQRGHSRNDDTLDIQVRLDKVPGWQEGDGLCFSWEYLKVRHGARLTSGVVYSLDQQGQWAKVVTEVEREAINMLREGKSVRQIAAKLDVDRNKIQRLLKKVRPASGLETGQAEGKEF
jgi:AAA domain/Homeodomain-like domain